jgi:hypothetical protein
MFATPAAYPDWPPSTMTAIPTLLKVFGLSLAIALGIKYAIAPLTIPMNDAIALALVILPTAVMSGWLGYQFVTSRSNA